MTIEEFSKAIGVVYLWVWWNWVRVLFDFTFFAAWWVLWHWLLPEQFNFDNKIGMLGFLTGALVVCFINKHWYYDHTGKHYKRIGAK